MLEEYYPDSIDLAIGQLSQIVRYEATAHLPVRSFLDSSGQNDPLLHLGEFPFLFPSTSTTNTQPSHQQGHHLGYLGDHRQRLPSIMPSLIYAPVALPPRSAYSLMYRTDNSPMTGVCPFGDGDEHLRPAHRANPLQCQAQAFHFHLGKPLGGQVPVWNESRQPDTNKSLSRCRILTLG